MTVKEFYKYAKKIAHLYPQIEDKVRDIYFITETEIEDGANSEHQLELAINTIDQLVAECILDE